MDQYINPRNLTAFGGIFAIVAVLDRKYVRAGLFLSFAATIHPLMAAFAFFYATLLMWIRRRDLLAVSFASALPLTYPIPDDFPRLSPGCRVAYLSLLSTVAMVRDAGRAGTAGDPLGFSLIARSRQMWNVDLTCRGFILFEAICIVAGVILSASPRFETLARIQPMRSLYLLYMVMILLAGGFAGQYLLKSHAWRWLALFLPLCGGMFYAQRQLFPASAHIEWPGMTSRNPWVQAFRWVRDNTPADAIFALDPDYMRIPGEDSNGFRAIAQRSMLADATKDSGAVTMFPPLAEEWQRQVQAQSGWKNFQPEELSRLHATYGVNWVVVQQPGVGNMSCPYRNQAVMVCRLN